MGLVVKTKVVTVTTPGTAVPVFATGDGFQQNNIVAAVLQPQANPVFFGDSTTKASAGIGQQIAAGVAQSLGLNDDRNSVSLSSVFIDSATAGTKVNVNFWVRL